MGELSRRQIIAIGAAVVFAPSLIIGLVVAHFSNGLTGAIAGFLMFVVTLVVAQIVITRRFNEMKASQEAQQAITKRLEELHDAREDDNHGTE